MLPINKIINLTSSQLNVIILAANEKPYEIIVEHLNEPNIGNIYLGIVRAKAEADNAFFVEYQKENLGYLRTPKNNLALGEKILVMIKKTGAGKIPELTTDISISGNFIIYKPLEAKLIAASKKLQKGAKEDFKQLFASKVSDNEGVIIRSSAQNTNIKNVFNEFELLKTTKTVLETNLKPLSCIYKKENLLEELVANYAPNILQIITNNITNFNKMKYFCQNNLPELILKIEHFKNRQIFNDYEIIESFEQIASNNVIIKPKGELSIIQTPALTAIDVDSKSAKNDDDFLNSWIYEVVLQIRLRNLSGKIIIDPPFLPNAKKFKKIVSLFENLLQNDSVHSYVAGVSPLGNIEISRERIRPTMLEILCGSDNIYHSDFKETAFDNFINKLEKND